MAKSQKNDDQIKTKRFTKQRQAILETLKSTYKHPDANWIYQKVSKKLPNISLGTVYRNLNILCEENLVKEISFQPNVTRYDADTKSHNHVMCKVCYKVEDLHSTQSCNADLKLQEKLTSELKYKDLSCEILFIGICPDCQNGSKTNS